MYYWVVLTMSHLTKYNARASVGNLGGQAASDISWLIKGMITPHLSRLTEDFTFPPSSILAKYVPAVDKALLIRAESADHTFAMPKYVGGGNHDGNKQQAQLLPS